MTTHNDNTSPIIIENNIDDIQENENFTINNKNSNYLLNPNHDFINTSFSSHNFNDLVGHILNFRSTYKLPMIIMYLVNKRNLSNLQKSWIIILATSSLGSTILALLSYQYSVFLLSIAAYAYGFLIIQSTDKNPDTNSKLKFLIPLRSFDSSGAKDLLKILQYFLLLDFVGKDLVWPLFSIFSAQTKTLLYSNTGIFLGLLSDAHLLGCLLFLLFYLLKEHPSKNIHSLEEFFSSYLVETLALSFFSLSLINNTYLPRLLLISLVFLSSLYNMKRSYGSRTILTRNNKYTRNIICLFIISLGFIPILLILQSVNPLRFLPSLYLIGYLLCGFFANAINNGFESSHNLSSSKSSYYQYYTSGFFFFLGLYLHQPLKFLVPYANIFGFITILLLAISIFEYFNKENSYEVSISDNVYGRFLKEGIKIALPTFVAFAKFFDIIQYSMLSKEFLGALFTLLTLISFSILFIIDPINQNSSNRNTAETSIKTHFDNLILSF